MRTPISLLVTLLLPLIASANPHAQNSRLHRRHQQRRDLSRLQERGSHRATFFDVGLGACGIYNVASDFIIALAVPDYADGKYCFKSVTISYNGKTTQAQVTDECMGCGAGEIDMSRGLFDFFASESVGEIFVDWNFGSDAQPSSTSKPPPKPSSISPTSTWTPPKTSTTSSSSAWSSSSTTTSSSSSSSTSVTPTSTSTPTSTAMAPVQTPTTPQNLVDLCALVVGLGQLVFSNEH